MKKKIFGVTLVLLLVASTTIIAYAGFYITQRAQAYPESVCGRLLGGLELQTEWDYYDGDYVQVRRIKDSNNQDIDNISFSFAPNYNTVIHCNPIYNSGASGYLTTVSMEYFVVDGDCSVLGKLSMDCDVWGETSESNSIIYRECNH